MGGRVVGLVHDGILKNGLLVSPTGSIIFHTPKKNGYLEDHPSKYLETAIYEPWKGNLEGEQP